jgi:hypothetical protein
LHVETVGQVRPRPTYQLGGERFGSIVAIRGTVSAISGPTVAPGLMASGPLSATESTRELWVLFMGTLNTSLGAGFLGWHAMQQAWRVPNWSVRPARQAEPLALPQPTRAGVV